MSITLAGTDLWASAGVDCDTQIRRRETGLGAVSGSLAKQPASLWLATIAFPSTSLQDGSSQRAVEAVERWFKAPVLGVASAVATSSSTAAAAGITNITRLLAKNKGVRVRAQRKGGAAAGAVAEAAAAAPKRIFRRRRPRRPPGHPHGAAFARKALA